MAPVPSFRTLYFRPDSDSIKSLVSTSVVGSARTAFAGEDWIRAAAPAVPAVRTKDRRSEDDDIVMEKAAAEPTSARTARRITNLTMMGCVWKEDKNVQEAFLLDSSTLICSMAVMKFMTRY
jgi:hypothetical protein